MNVFVIGGTTVDKADQRYLEESALLNRTMQVLGQEIIHHGHVLSVCSPFEGSADAEAVKGAAARGSDRTEAFVHFYIPDAPAVRESLLNLARRAPKLRWKEFIARGPTDLRIEESRNHAWLLAQLCALDRCHAVVAVGGKPTGPMSLLLPLAETRRKCVAPLRFLGGAAAESFERQRHNLLDRLGEKILTLGDPEKVDSVVEVLERLATERPAAAAGRKPCKLFLSYPQSRPAEADFVEMLLRRRNLTVFRDERDFGAGQIVEGEINSFLCQSDVFIALWCKDYACSPWCYDEMDSALKRHEEQQLTMWLLCLDETRMVPPKARQLISYPAYTREALEGALLRLLDQMPRELP